MPKTDLDKLLEDFIKANPQHHGAGGWLENNLDADELAILEKMYHRGFGVSYINRFVIHGLGHKDCTEGKLGTWLKALPPRVKT